MICFKWSYLVPLSCVYRSLFKRSLSDGNILHENNTLVAGGNIGQKKLPSSALTEKILKGGANHGHSDSTPDISTCESDISYSRLAYLTYPSLMNSFILPVSSRRLILYLTTLNQGRSLSLTWFCWQCIGISCLH